jgi:hypothetical protein
MCDLDLCCGLCDLEICCGGATGAPERDTSNANIEQPEKSNKVPQ